MKEDNVTSLGKSTADKVEIDSRGIKTETWYDKSVGTETGRKTT